MPPAAPSASKSQVPFVAAIVTAEVLGMLGISSFAGLLPEFARLWHLSATEAGWISGLYYAGYVAAVPVLTALTDRIDPRRIYLASTALGGIANLGFALTAHGFWSAVGWQVLSGLGLAGTYMPGLKALTDRVAGPHQSRALASYTSGFSVGIGGSFMIAGALGMPYGWRWAFFVPAATSALAFLIASLALKPIPAQSHARPQTRLLDFRPVLTNRAAMGYVVGYGFHVWELFGVRSWVVAFLAFSVTLQPPGSAHWSPTLIATLLTLLGVVFSISGNELCLRFGRRRTLPLLMLSSCIAACGIGFTAPWNNALVSCLCLFYGGLVMVDSSSLTAGLVEVATPGYRGATMAVYSSIGFMGAFLGPIVFGTMLDRAGGPSHVASWGLAFASLGIAVGCGALALVILRPRDASGPA
ncbi:MAG TPA: MFS transporter [Alphaproteobacteria bacterium]|nr:MFS transporter [Alphaproteobacteria bacterium]